MVPNSYLVPKKQWEKWKVGEELPRRVFNDVYDQMSRSPEMYVHSDLREQKIPAEHAHVSAWNSAWIAADSVRDAYKEIA
jgi:hypothetical protein